MKIIIFTQRVEIIENYNERRDCADQEISKMIWDCGYLPVPISNNPAIVESFIECFGKDENGYLAGIVLTGGNDLVKFGGNAPERDETEKILIEYGLHNNIPIYGFCRGMQMIADYFGCRLIHVDNHVGIKHRLSGDKIFEGREVNSYHNYAIKDVKDPLIVSARAHDGIIESIFHKNKIIYGTMWHPERENPFNERDIEFIRGIFG